ncbi:hypothetical protein BJ912DRAFT_1057499 [Pholiota molesta]|nr:hypothetical protein BJ912DRAFT_1065722 [Pholiota molesta]KAF8193297.1 hypothetical protein BJ912DRAFT_1057499 [Pholiota molesta]
MPCIAVCTNPKAELDTIEDDVLIQGALAAISDLAHCPDDCKFLISKGPHGFDDHLTGRVYSNKDVYLGAIHFTIKEPTTPTLFPPAANTGWMKKKFTSYKEKREILCTLPPTGAIIGMSLSFLKQKS